MMRPRNTLLECQISLWWLHAEYRRLRTTSSTPGTRSRSGGLTVRYSIMQVLYSVHSFKTALEMPSIIIDVTEVKSSGIEISMK
jgi:hypothetical protein